MAIVVKDRVKETTTTTGQGTITLLGAAEGYVSFATIGNGNTTYYTIYNPEDGSFEVGIGTYTSSGTTLSRTTVLANSLGTTAKIDFTAGVKDVFCTYPAEKAIYEEPSGNTLIDGGPLTVVGAGVSPGYATFSAALAEMYGNVNSYAQAYARNLMDDTEASADFIVYRNNTTVETANFMDMGINSSSFSSATWPIFTQGSMYLYGNGGEMFIGSETSDVVFFSGGVQTTDEVARFSHTTGELTTRESINVTGNVNAQGGTFTAPVTTTSSMISPANDEFVTKSYVDTATSTGIHIHTPCTSETSAALSAVYTQGGTTFNITDITGTNTVVTSTTHGLSVNDEIWLYSTAGNGLSTNTAYFVYATPTTTSLQLSLSYNGQLLTGLTNASGLSYATRANSGVGAYLESSANQALPIADVIVGDRVLVYQQATGYWNGVYTVTALGAADPGGSKWKLTRATDANKYEPDNTAGMGAGDYFFIQSNSESYVLTDPTGPIIIGYDTITYTLFSSVPQYIVDSPLQLVGNELSLTTVPATLGGTGYSSYTVGQLLYADTTTTLAKLGVGSPYQTLVVNGAGTLPEWNSLNLSSSNAVTGQLGATYGGTGQSTYATGDMLYSSASNTLSKLSGNTSTTKQFLTQTGTGSASQAPAWGTISGSDVTSAVSSATNVAGGAANKIVYQTGPGATGFIDAPVSSNTALTWNGSSFTWASAGGATITNDTTTNTNYYPVWANASSGTMTTAYVSSTKLTYNPGLGIFNLSSTDQTGTLVITDAGTSGANIKLAGNGVTTPNKFIRTYNGNLEVVNNGYTAAILTLTDAGNLTAAGTVTASSDETLKTNWRDLPADFVEQLAKVKHGTYDRVDLELTQDGVSAQSLQTLLPNSVLEGDDGKLSVAYGNAALVAAIKLAERVVQLEAIVAKLTQGVAK